MSKSSGEPTSETPWPHLAGRRLGDYELIRRLGRGAMAEVYLAVQQSLQRQVAIKILRQELARDQSYVKRFRHEATAAARLTHANIVQIFEVNRIDGLYFIAQEYVPGRNLAELIERIGSLPAAAAATILGQVARALQKAAEHGIVHRDIKPENILLSPAGEAKVADFGLARYTGGEDLELTQIGMTMGTPLYMSPEQVEGRALDSRSDLYSLGITCYHMLAGRPPFDGETALAVAVAHLNSQPPPLDEVRPDLPPGLSSLVHKMMAKRLVDRHQSPRELLDDLQSLAIPEQSGWAEGYAESSDTMATALPGTPAEMTHRLGELMQTGSLLSSARPRLRAWMFAALCSLVIGIGLGIFVRRDSLLSHSDLNDVPRRNNAWQQLYHAKMTDSPAAWKGVEKYFPGSDHRYTTNLSKVGLARLYLKRPAQVHQALPLLEDLAAQPESEFRAFGLAGQCVVFSWLDQPDRASQRFAQLTPELFDRVDPQMRALLNRRSIPP